MLLFVFLDWLFWTNSLLITKFQQSLEDLIVSTSCCRNDAVYVLLIA